MARFLEPATLSKRPQTSEASVVEPEFLLRAAAPLPALDRQHRVAVAPPDPDLGAIVTDGEIALLDPRGRPPLETLRELGHEELSLDLHPRIKPHATTDSQLAVEPERLPGAPVSSPYCGL